jgi:hypothetical protein
MFIPDPDFYPSRIPDPKISTKERGGKKFFHTFFCSHKFHKIEKYFSFEVQKKKLGAVFKELEIFLPKKIVATLKNMGLGSGIQDPGSGKNLFRIPDPGVKKAPDPGVKKAPDPGSGSATLDFPMPSKENCCIYQRLVIYSNPNDLKFSGFQIKKCRLQNRVRI